MHETDAELQLRVWKELAVSKQLLMRGATDALKLDPNCSQEELQVALESAIKRSIEADVDVGRAQEQAKIAIEVAEKKLRDSQKAQNIAEKAAAEALAKQEQLQQQNADERNNAANVTKKMRDDLAEKDRALKAINSALSDTPENVLKKMKTLKKQKMDESDARKQADKTVIGLRKDKQKLESTVKDMTATQESAVQLAELYRELHTLCGTLHEQLEPLVDDAASLAEVPALDSALLESIEPKEEK